jgi:hypothetical protein
LVLPRERRVLRESVCKRARPRWCSSACCATWSIGTDTTTTPRSSPRTSSSSSSSQLVSANTTHPSSTTSFLTDPPPLQRRCQRKVIVFFIPLVAEYTNLPPPTTRLSFSCSCVRRHARRHPVSSKRIRAKYVHIYPGRNRERKMPKNHFPSPRSQTAPIASKMGLDRLVLFSRRLRVISERERARCECVVSHGTPPPRRHGPWSLVPLQLTPKPIRPLPSASPSIPPPPKQQTR